MVMARLQERQELNTRNARVKALMPETLTVEAMALLAREAAARDDELASVMALVPSRCRVLQEALRRAHEATDDVPADEGPY